MWEYVTRLLFSFTMNSCRLEGAVVGCLLWLSDISVTWRARMYLRAEDSPHNRISTVFPISKVVSGVCNRICVLSSGSALPSRLLVIVAIRLHSRPSRLIPKNILPFLAPVLVG